MTEVAVPNETLRRKLSLLLHRERELFDLRNVRSRTESWLRAFHDLSLTLGGDDARALVVDWAAMMVGQLNFEVAAAFEYDLPSGTMRHAAVDPGPADPNASLDPAMIAFLDAQRGGMCRRDTEGPVRAVGLPLGLEAFFWFWTRPSPTSGQLLVAGYSPRTVAVRRLLPRDESHFLMLAGHLAALVSSAERARVERELRSAQRLEAVGRMAAGLAHEVNSPLAVVIANVDLCRSDLAAFEEGALAKAPGALLPALDDAADSAERIRRIVADIQTFASRGLGAAVPLDLREAIDAAVRRCDGALRHAATFTLDLSTLPPVLLDRRSLEQVLVNLLVNATQAMSAARRADNRISLTARQEGREVLIEIRDNGQGIPREHLERIYDPFFTTHRIGQGMGLGLSVCQGIVEAAGGRITLESEEGVGTTARVRLPVAESTSSSGRGAEATKPKGRILAIDDEPSLLRALARTLTAQGFQVTTCAHSNEALEIYTAGQFDVVLCDLMMPGLDGMALHAQFTALGPEHAARMIFMTGGAFSPAAQAFLATTAKAWIAKPLNLEQLLGMVNALTPA